jgi:hypothetical protein
MEIDLHGYHPAEIVFNGVLADILKQAWEMGETELTLLLQLGLQPVYVLVTSMPWER